MVSTAPLLALLGFGSLGALLQGCGKADGPEGGGDGPSTTTTTTFRPRTPGMSGKEAQDHLNKLFMSFDEKNDNSSLGVVMTLVAKETSFWKNIYCSEFDNPVLGKTGCSMGRADCRMSASLYNHKMMLNSATGAINLGLSRHIGIVFNLTMTQTYFGKCSYIWDGASDRRYNRGCGDGAPGDDCNSTKTAWFNQCERSSPGKPHTCTEQDDEVKTALCNGYMGGKTSIPTCHSCGPQCLFPGPALSFHGQADWAPVTDNLRDMAKARVANQDGTDKDPQQTPKVEEWNEVVIDNELLVPQLWRDPAVAIPAIVVVSTAPNAVKQDAYRMRDELCTTMGLKDKMPVVEVDPSRVSDPFVFKSNEYSDNVASEIAV